MIVTRLAELLPPAVKVLIIADRGYGDTKLYRVLKDELHFDYVIRSRSNIKVTVASQSHPAKDWLGPSGRASAARGDAHRAILPGRRGIVRAC